MFILQTALFGALALSGANEISPAPATQPMAGLPETSLQLAQFSESEALIDYMRMLAESRSAQSGDLPADRSAIKRRTLNKNLLLIGVSR